MRGPIVKGDSGRFRTVLDGAILKFRDHRMRIVALDSSGGELSEALAMTEIVHSRGYATIVPDAANCVSACVLVFASGDQKYFSSTAHIGVHGASDEGGKQDVGALAATVGIAKLFAAFGVPDTVIARMVVTAPEDISWLGTKDLMLFPNSSNFDSSAADFSEVGAGYDGISFPAHPKFSNEQAFKEGFEYGYTNYGGCENIAITLRVNFQDSGDVQNGCYAGLNALRREHQTMVPLAPHTQEATFGKPPPHTPALLRQASIFLDAFSDGYWSGQGAHCEKFRSFADICQTAIERRQRAESGSEPLLTKDQIEHDFGPQEWLDAYDWEYTHHEVWCGVIRAPSTLGCEAAARDWPRQEHENARP